MHALTRVFVAAVVVIVGAVVVSACSNTKLKPVDLDEPRNVDDLVDIEANFCTRPVEDVVFPVKLLLVLDTSGSLQFTDQSGLRRPAVRDLMSSLATENDLFVATIGFGSNIYTDPPITPGSPLFVPAAQWVEPAFLGLADVQTNYHGALAAVKTHILMDLLNSDPAEIARSKYVVIFFSDGAPTPKCCISVDETVGTLGPMPFDCAPEAYEVAQPDVRYCEGEPEQTLCNEEDFLDRFRDRTNSGLAPDYGDGTLEALNELEPNDNYNRTYQAETLVTDIMELGEQFGVGELRFHSALLYDSTLPDNVKEIYRLNRCRSERLLQRMAELGNGIYRDFENSEEIDFLSFNFTSLKQGFTLLRAYAYNGNALPALDPLVKDFRSDSDGDGISDDEELDFGTDASVKDSDKLPTPPAASQAPDPITDPSAWGDGYGDLFEKNRIAIGFDPRFQSLPVTACPGFDPSGIDQQDLDGDGLNGCEEYIVESDPKRADTDGDGLPDGVELRLGLNPARHEANGDNDFDGLPNVEEVIRGVAPLTPDVDRRERDSVRYELQNLGETDDGRICYRSFARGVHLASTGPRFAGGRSGYNDVQFIVAEAPTDNPTGRVEIRVACARAQYIKPSFKDPANGQIVLNEEDFVDLSDPADLQRLQNGEDICTGVEVR